MQPPPAPSAPLSPSASDLSAMVAASAAAGATPSPAAIWAMLCAASGVPIPPASGAGSGSSNDANVLFPNVRYLPLMPLPRAMNSESSSSSSRGRRKRGQQRSRTNSERGKDFRARQRSHELDLLKTLTTLQSEVHKLQVTRDLQRESALQTRQGDMGSLVRVVREYHKLFFMGAPEVLVENMRSAAEVAEIQNVINRQHQFLRHAIDPDLMLGELRGVGVLMEIWKRYTKCHRDLRMKADEFVISGSEDKPIITAYGTMRTRYTRETIQYLFPHVIHNEALVQKFIGKEVIYQYRNIYEFSDDGRVVTYIPEVEFIQALLNAGGSLRDVSELMQQAQIASQYIVGPVEEDGHISASIELLDEVVALPESTARNCKHKLDFLLSTAEEDGGEDDGDEYATYPLMA